MSKRYVFKEIKGVKTLSDSLSDRVFTFEDEVDFKDMEVLLNTVAGNGLDLHENFNEWESILGRLEKNEPELIGLKEKFNQLSEKIIEETDFKALYGKNNESIRKNHVKRELSDIVEQINILELAISKDKRRINFIDSLIRMKIELIKYE